MQLILTLLFVIFSVCYCNNEKNKSITKKKKIREDWFDFRKSFKKQNKLAIDVYVLNAKVLLMIIWKEDNSSVLKLVVWSKKSFSSQFCAVFCNYLKLYFNVFGSNFSDFVQRLFLHFLTVVNFMLFKHIDTRLKSF